MERKPVASSNLRDVGFDKPSRVLEVLCLSDKTLERFEAKYVPEPNTGCWLWFGAIQSTGYGHFCARGIIRLAHRVSYGHHVGHIPEGLEIDHLCRTRNCVNPAHLEPVTRKVNVLRGVSPSAKCATAAHCPQGHPYDAENTRINSNGGRVCRKCWPHGRDYPSRRRTFDR